MWNRVQKCLVAIAAAAVVIGAVAADRSAIADKDKWNLDDLYPSRAAWNEAREQFAKRIGDLAPFKGHLGDSAQTLLKALQTQEDMTKELYRLYVYAGMTYDLDTRVSDSMAMRQSMAKLGNDYSAAASFVEPEILSLDEAKVASFYASEPGLAVFKPYLDDILRMKAHTLSPEEERIVAQTGSLSGAPGSIYGVFTSADMPYPEVTLSTGEKVRLDNAGYAKYRASGNRADRDKVFKAFWETYAAYRRTLGATLYSHVRGHVFSKDVRKYDSCLQRALDADNIPTQVYRQLIKDVHDNLPTLHRYLKLRQRMMGVDQLRYEDLYAPLVKEVDLTFTPDEARGLVLKAVAPLGPDYVKVLKGGYESRWVDFFPSTGKRSGAYSNGAAYDVHPYMLLNFNGRYDDVSTLAHESGHTMHSYLSNKNQSFTNSRYSIFVAEVASTLNENLLFHTMLDETKDDATRLFLLGEYLDGFRQTLFRQTLFAEFELRIHEMAETGEPLTGDSLSKLYLDLVRTYYGHDKGVCQVDELYGNEWAFIPHFYRNFYVYQYATSLTASTFLANRIRSEAGGDASSRGARDAYINMLSSGSIKYPVELLKDAGVDMTTSAPFDASMKEMNAVMDQIESILAKKPGA